MSLIDVFLSGFLWFCLLISILLFTQTNCVIADNITSYSFLKAHDILTRRNDKIRIQNHRQQTFKRTKTRIHIGAS